MAYFDILDPIELSLPGAKTPGQLMDYTDALMYEARTKKFRRKHGMNAEEELIEATNGEHNYKVLTWNRRIQRTEANLSLVDKRAAKLGFMLTVQAGVEIPGIEVVKVFVLNDELAHSGLKRIVNRGEAEDVAGIYLDALHRSTVAYPLDTSIPPKQRQDYKRALASVFLPQAGL